MCASSGSEKSLGAGAWRHPPSPKIITVSGKRAGVAEMSPLVWLGRELQPGPCWVGDALASVHSGSGELVSAWGCCLSTGTEQTKHSP